LLLSDWSRKDTGSKPTESKKPAKGASVPNTKNEKDMKGKKDVQKKFTEMAKKG
jgi:hypothetical protein